jgi:hypothetical protein
LPTLLETLKRHERIVIDQETQTLLLSMSVATADRLLKGVRLAERGRGLSTTRPGTLLRDRIPIRTGCDWDDHAPGFFEIDLVAHCGETTAGQYVNTLTMTDVGTGWTECTGVPNRGQKAVFDAIQNVRRRLPFELKGIDSDNGSEFINELLFRYCETEHITFTRCRPYKKNDQAHVEQKNWSVVRRTVGYDRLEGDMTTRLLNKVYSYLRLYINFFQPSMKLTAKKREGAKVSKKYDTAATPFARLAASGVLTHSQREDMETLYLGLDPVELLEQIREALRNLHRYKDGLLQQCNADDDTQHGAQPRGEQQLRLEN